MDRRERERAAAEARERLKRVGTEGDTLFGSAASRVRDHFTGADAPKDDRAERWGRVIGRTLALAFTVFLVWWLAATYL